MMMDPDQEQMRSYLKERHPTLKAWDMTLLFFGFNKSFQMRNYIEIILHHYSNLRQHGVIPACFEYLEGVRCEYEMKQQKEFHRLLRATWGRSDDTVEREDILKRRLEEFKENFRKNVYKPKWVIPPTSDPVPVGTLSRGQS